MILDVCYLAQENTKLLPHVQKRQVVHPDYHNTSLWECNHCIPSVNYSKMSFNDLQRRGEQWTYRFKRTMRVSFFESLVLKANTIVG